MTIIAMILFAYFFLTSIGGSKEKPGQRRIGYKSKAKWRKNKFR